MQIKLTSVMVDDQEKALKFYTEVLGFIKKRDIPVGKHKYLTVVSRKDRRRSNCCWNLTTMKPPKSSKKPFSDKKYP